MNWSSCQIQQIGLKKLFATSRLGSGLVRSDPKMISSGDQTIYGPVGGQHYFVIECKNGSAATTINKTDVNQLNGSLQWFHAEYQSGCTCTPVIVHPSDVCEHAATPDPKARVITSELLRKAEGCRSEVHRRRDKWYQYCFAGLNRQSSNSAKAH